jgi:hypothetical protein
MYYNLTSKHKVDNKDSHNVLYLRAHELSSLELDPFKKISEIMSKWNLEGLEQTIVGSAKKAAEDIIEGKILDDLQKLLDELDKAYGIFAENMYGYATPGKIVDQFILPLPPSFDSELKHSYVEDKVTPGEVLMKKLPGMLAVKFAKPNIASIINKSVESGIEIAKRHNYNFNPNIINTYSGTEPRTLNISFNIVPQSRKHALEVIDGILKLRILASGTQLAENLFIKQDHVFSIKFSDKLEKLLYFEDKYLNLVSVTTELMSSTGSGSFTHDGVPKNIKVTLSLQERMPLRRKEEGGGKKPEDKNASVTKKAASISASAATAKAVQYNKDNLKNDKLKKPTAPTKNQVKNSLKLGKRILQGKK